MRDEGLFRSKPHRGCGSARLLTPPRVIDIRRRSSKFVGEAKTKKADRGQTRASLIRAKAESDKNTFLARTQLGAWAFLHGPTGPRTVRHGGKSLPRAGSLPPTACMNLTGQPPVFSLRLRLASGIRGCLGSVRRGDDEMASRRYCGIKRTIANDLDWLGKVRRRGPASEFKGSNVSILRNSIQFSISEGF